MKIFHKNGKSLSAKKGKFHKNEIFPHFWHIDLFQKKWVQGWL
jgi:hypothetical protein